VPAEFVKLWADAQSIWDEHHDETEFEGYVSADYRAVYEVLAELQGSVVTFLEWGSGLGVVAIMASLMGYEAYGIEAEPRLVRFADQLAGRYGSNAQFAEGSFIPDDFVWNPAIGDEVQRTNIDAASGYEELGLELRDFDLVYAYPWPDEHSLFHSIMREYGRKNALMLTYDAREGIELLKNGHL
jgi:hypothetical protein